MKHFKILNPDDFNGNVFKMISTDWLLLSAGQPDNFNVMTASWGALGHLWNSNIAIIFIRPTRFTFLFTEKYQFFTISFFDEKYRDILNVCGNTSGRNFDKIKATGLVPIQTQLNNIIFQQSSLVFECKKLYASNIDPECFLDPKIENLYPAKDYHKMYIAEIINIFRNPNS